MDEIQVLDISYKGNTYNKKTSSDLFNEDSRSDGEVLDNLFSNLIRKYEQVIPSLDDPKEILELTRAVSELKRAFSDEKNSEKYLEDISAISLSKFKGLLKEEF